MSDREDREPRRTFPTDPWVAEQLDGEPIPPPPARLLEDGLALIRRTFADRPQQARLPARLAAAAASDDGADEVELFEAEQELRTRWVRSAEGVLSVTVTAADPGEAALVALSWQRGEGSPLTLVTPLAPAPHGAYVRYELDGDERRAAAVHIDVGAARRVAPADVDLDAVRQAFVGHPKGVAIRAWRTYLDRAESPARLDSVVRDLLRSYDR